MGIFSGIKDAKTAGAGSNPTFTDGTYLLQVDKFSAWESKNPKNKGQGMVCVEGTVLETLRDTTDPQGRPSLKPGVRGSWIRMLERGPNGSLTQKGEMNMERVKGFVAAAMGLDPADAPIDESVCEALTEGDGESIKGIRLVADFQSGESKNGAKFQNATFTPAAAEEG